MGTKCSTICREDASELPSQTAGKGAGMNSRKDKTQETQFWHEKMRFSQASQLLFDAALRGDVEMALKAIRALGDPNCCSSHGFRPLQLAISGGHVSMVELLLKAAADINGHSDVTPPPLVLASGSGDARLFDVMLENGADMNIADKPSGETALMRASERGHYRLVQALLARGSPGFQKLLAQRPRVGPMGDGATALHLAASNGHRDVCDKLLGVGADPNAADRSGQLALHKAVIGAHVETTELLLHFGSGPSIADRDGQTPLHLAALQGNLTLCDTLMRHGSDSNSRRLDGKAPLHLSAIGGFDVLCEMMLQRSADANAVDGNGETAYEMAFRQAHIRTCRTLLGCGAEVRAVSANRWVPPYTEIAPRVYERYLSGATGMNGVDDAQSDRAIMGC